jgi:hypothetical protein
VPGKRGGSAALLKSGCDRHRRDDTARVRWLPGALDSLAEYGTPNVARYGGTIISPVEANPTLSGACGTHHGP